MKPEMKTQIMKMLERQLVLLKQLRDNLADEYQLLTKAEADQLTILMNRRFELLECFDQGLEQLRQQLIICHLAAGKNLISFDQVLEIIKKRLTIEDVDLHLAVDQAQNMILAIRDLMAAIIYSIQEGGLQSDTINQLSIKAEPEALKTVIGVLEL